MPAARASWFALPATNEANVNAGFRLVCSLRRAGADVATGPAAARARARRAARTTSPRGARGDRGASTADSRTASVIGIASPSAAASSPIRSAKRSLTHCRTNRLGASSRYPPSTPSMASGRIQVLNCCGVSSSRKAARQRCQKRGTGLMRTGDFGGLARRHATDRRGIGRGRILARRAALIHRPTGRTRQSARRRSAPLGRRANPLTRRPITRLNIRLFHLKAFYLRFHR